MPRQSYDQFARDYANSVSSYEGTRHTDGIGEGALDSAVTLGSLITKFALFKSAKEKARERIQGRIDSTAFTPYGVHGMSSAEKEALAEDMGTHYGIDLKGKGESLFPTPESYIKQKRNVTVNTADDIVENALVNKFGLNKLQNWKEHKRLQPLPADQRMSAVLGASPNKPVAHLGKLQADFDEVEPEFQKAKANYIASKDFGMGPESSYRQTMTGESREPTDMDLYQKEIDALAAEYKTTDVSKMPMEGIRKLEWINRRHKINEEYDPKRKKMLNPEASARMDAMEDEKLRANDLKRQQMEVNIARINADLEYKKSLVAARSDTYQKSLMDDIDKRINMPVPQMKAEATFWQHQVDQDKEIIKGMETRAAAAAMAAATDINAIGNKGDIYNKEYERQLGKMYMNKGYPVKPDLDMQTGEKIYVPDQEKALRGINLDGSVKPAYAALKQLDITHPVHRLSPADKVGIKALINKLEPEARDLYTKMLEAYEGNTTTTNTGNNVLPGNNIKVVPNASGVITSPSGKPYGGANTMDIKKVPMEPTRPLTKTESRIQSQMVR